MKYIIRDSQLMELAIIAGHVDNVSQHLQMMGILNEVKSKQPVEPGAELTGKQFEFRTIHEGDYIDYVRTKLYPKEINIKIYIQKD